ncbi:MAG TPA: dTDP-4-dehydrorhamnose 3,5-epimerase [Myxococcaceae bacterium]|nr:dTDP-4-dehydrorhamnose 3,5-epimerase [Myxococcaceae bacterium]
MKVTETPLPGVRVIEVDAFGDSRGLFFELYQARRYLDAGIDHPFVQDNFSRSTKDTLRGLHFQEPHPQGKLVQVLQGTVFDVAVDIRRGSPTFARWFGIELSGDNKRQLWIPPGFAHGFCVTSSSADFLYKCTEYYVPEADRGIAWNDPDLAISWPTQSPLLSKKDAAAPRLSAAPLLPSFLEGKARK